ncbi:MAG: Maf family protein, partial [Clostridia bacterium]|nr:Maf family protein [Clostridia bacterium]
SSYSGRSHEVITGFAIVCDGKILSASTSTKVFFKNLSGAQIKYYLDTDEPYDKAGAYGIQGIAGLFVNRIEGDYNNVVGLPLCDLDSLMIEKFGFGLNKFKKS